MPAPAVDPLAVLIRRTRRRMAAARLGDAVFVGVAAGGVAGAALRAGGPAVVAAFTGGPAVAVASAWGIGIPGVAVVVGAVLAARRPPRDPAVAAWLDRRHDTRDLLASAWATRRAADPWAAGLHTLAAEKAAAILATARPADDRVARFSVRHHACLWAALLAVWLATGLVTPAARDGAGDTAKRLADGRAAVDMSGPTRTADVVRRAGDTADEATAVPDATTPPGPADAAASGRRPVDAAGPANGPGRGDVPGPVRTPPAREPAFDGRAPRPDSTTPGGPGRAGGATSTDGHDGPGSAVIADGKGDATPSSPPSSDAAGDRTRPPDGAPSRGGDAVPGPYRGMVRDFFDR